MVRVRLKQPRGQSTTELALGLLVFVTILLFGIHFAEVGYLSLKVQEAAASALWDTTSAKMHTLPKKFEKLENLISSNKPGQLATDRYKDFDGRTSKAGSQAPRLLLTSAADLSVTCEEAKNISFEPSEKTKGVYKDVGGMRCSSRAQLSPTSRFTRNFLDSGSGAFFSVPHYAMGVIPVCGVGRASGGECKAGFGILLDDWGLAGPEESKECPVLKKGGCDNKPYYESAQDVYKKHNTVNGSAEALATFSVGKSPIGDASQFWMSFRGMGSSFTDKENGGDKDPNNWVTTPGAKSPTPEYKSAFSQRKKCFLGTDKCT